VYKSVTGTNQVPPHLEFLNYPDSSLMSSFPNTPHDSGENSASSGNSVMDADEAVTLKKPATKAPLVPAALKRRLHGSESRPHSPAKVTVPFVFKGFLPTYKLGGLLQFLNEEELHKQPGPQHGSSSALWQFGPMMGNPF